MSEEFENQVQRLKNAIDTNDLPLLTSLITQDPSLHSAPMGYGNNGPLTWASECRGTEPTADRLAIIQWLLENGSDVHQGGDGPLMRAALSDDRIPVMELLVKHGANVNAVWGGHYPIILAPCETLQPQALGWLIDHGADPNLQSEDCGSCVSMLIGTYMRNAKGRQGCLKVFEDRGFQFPETAPVALHRGRMDLLEGMLNSDPTLLSRHFTAADIFPVVLGLDPADGLTFVPLEGATLLHMAAEFQDAESTQWLINHGADVNARAAIDPEGFGGHTPLFHTTVCPINGAAEIARLLLKAGADPNARATFRKQLRDMGNPDLEQMTEYNDVTPIQFAHTYQNPAWINKSALQVIEDFGGK